jgi:hypothetical protein
MDPKVPITFSQEADTSPCLVSDESSPHLYTLFL